MQSKKGDVNARGNEQPLLIELKVSAKTNELALAEADIVRPVLHGCLEDDTSLLRLSIRHNDALHLILTLDHILVRSATEQAEVLLIRIRCCRLQPQTWIKLRFSVLVV